jgi:hypothetical protein
MAGDAKWTQGPWWAETDHHQTVYDANKRRIADCSGAANMDPEGRAANTANARLIAAAPDLYAALERLRAEVIGHPAVVLWPESMRDALTDAVAALARARGEQP